MVSVCMIFFRRFYFFLKFSLLYFSGGFNKTIIPLPLVGYEMIIANSYPTHACGIIVNYILHKLQGFTRICSPEKSHNFTCVKLRS